MNKKAYIKNVIRTTLAEAYVKQANARRTSLDRIFNPPVEYEATKRYNLRRSELTRNYDELAPDKVSLFRRFIPSRDMAIDSLSRNPSTDTKIKEFRSNFGHPGLTGRDVNSRLRKNNENDLRARVRAGDKLTQARDDAINIFRKDILPIRELSPGDVISDSALRGYEPAVKKFEQTIDKMDSAAKLPARYRRMLAYKLRNKILLRQARNPAIALGTIGAGLGAYKLMKPKPSLLERILKKFN